jgi:hypothetical protein
MPMRGREAIAAARARILDEPSGSGKRGDAAA